MFVQKSYDDENIDELNQLLAGIPDMKEFSHILIMGDFNFPKINWNTWTSIGDKSGESFLESIRDSYLFQHVRDITRTRANCGPSTIDLLFTNEEGMLEDLKHTSPLGSSDHCGLDFLFKCYVIQNESKTERWNYFKGDYENMKADLDIDWEKQLKNKNTQEQLDTFLNIINIAKSKYIPKINPKANKKA